MVSRCGQFLLSLVYIQILMLVSSNGYAVEPMKADEPVFKPEVSRQDARIAKIDSENIEVGYYSGHMAFEDFGTNSVSGLFLAFHINEDVFLLGNYAETTIGLSSSEIVFSSPMFTSGERNITYYNLLLGYNVLPGEVFMGNKLAFNTDLYLVIGSGTTSFAGDDYATFVYGWGYRFLGTDWLSVHLDMRNHSFTHYKFAYEKRVSNLEVTLGLAIFF